MIKKFGSLRFGEVDSSDFDIYISGGGVYNAPERAVEFVDVPGRNGAVAIDQGHFNNIIITYPAGTFGYTPEQFAKKVAAFRNAIISQQGYQRLSDSYHPDEYRMGLYHAGLEVTPVSMNRGGEFQLQFNCKPQRWLTSGESATPIASGDMILNPTSFESSPLLEAEGDGDISFNGYTISLEDNEFGHIKIIDQASRVIGETDVPVSESSISSSLELKFNPEFVESGDEINLSWIQMRTTVLCVNGSFTSATYSTSGTAFSNEQSLYPATIGGGGSRCSISNVFENVKLTAGTSSSKTYTVTDTISGKKSDNTSIQTVFALEMSLVYDGDHTITITATTTLTTAGNGANSVVAVALLDSYAESTASVLGHPTYIDCDIGEVYRISNGEYISLNTQADLGSDLPVLAAGFTKITYDNTITDLKIVPRWWQL